MIPLIAVLFIYSVPWLLGHFPLRTIDHFGMIPFSIIVLSNVLYGMTCYEFKQDSWGDRALWAISYLLFIYSYIANWDIYMYYGIDRVINYDIQMPGDFGNIFVILVLVLVPILAIAGPVRNMIFGIGREVMIDEEGNEMTDDERRNAVSASERDEENR